MTSLTPRGVSGLKYGRRLPVARRSGSHPSRGEWIEIDWTAEYDAKLYRLTPRGVSGLKFLSSGARPMPTSLTPRGVSGLK